MQKKNPLYKNQGIHLISSIFTVDKGVVKVLLIRRNNEPYKDKWALVGGALYNNETVVDGMKREIKEKTGINDIILYYSNIYSRVDRSPIMRMVGLSYVGFLDIEKVNLLKETDKTNDSDWFPINNIPELAYDHNEILNDSILKLRELIYDSDILKSLFPNTLTLPELQSVYETILDKKIDRRNFRKKLIHLDILEDTKYKNEETNGRPAKLYRFKDEIEGEMMF